MGVVGMHAFGEACDRHRRLALAVELVETRPEELQRALEIGDVHRPAAVKDRPQIAQIGGGDRWGADEPRQHRWRRKHRDPRAALQRFDYRIHIEVRQHQLVAAAQ